MLLIPNAFVIFATARILQSYMNVLILTYKSLMTTVCQSPYEKRIKKKSQSLIYFAINMLMMPIASFPLQFTSTILYDPALRKKEPSSQYQKERDKCLGMFSKWNDDEQVEFVEQLLSQMCHYQHGHINAYLKPMLQRDFISLLPKKGLDHVADNILSYLDADSLFAAELVSKEWNRVISEGMLWKKLIERKVRSDSLWRGLAERKKWIKYLFVPRPGEYRNHSFYRQLYPVIMKVNSYK